MVLNKTGLCYEDDVVIITRPPSKKKKVFSPLLNPHSLLKHIWKHTTKGSACGFPHREKEKIAFEKDKTHISPKKPLFPLLLQFSI